MAKARWSEKAPERFGALDINTYLMVLDSAEPNPSLQVKRLTKSAFDSSVLSAVQKNNNFSGFEIFGGQENLAILTVEQSCWINQDLSTTSSVSFNTVSANSVNATGSPSSFNSINANNTSAWYGIVAGGNGSSQKVVLGGYSGGAAAIGGHNVDLTQWTNLYLQPQGGYNVGICLDPTLSQSPNARLHSAGTTILGLPNSPLSDSAFYNGNIHPWIDESTNELKFKVKNTLGNFYNYSLGSGAPSNLGKTTITYDGTYTDPQLTIRGQSNQNKQLRISFDTSINVTVFESLIAGSGHVATYYNSSAHYFQINGGPITTLVDSGGLKANTIGEATNGNGVTFVNNIKMFKPGPQITLQDSTFTTKQAYIYFTDSLYSEALNIGDQFYPFVFNHSRVDFRMGFGAPSPIGRIDSTGLSFNTINEYTANNGVRIAHKTSIGSTAAPVAKLSGFDSTFLGVGSGTFGSGALVAQQMEIWCDQGGPNWTLYFVRKGSDGSTVKTATLTMT